MQKTIAFQYTNNKLSKKKRNQENNSILNSNRKKNKYLGINLTKEKTDLYTENYKTLMKDLKKTQAKGKTSSAHRLEDLILLKWQYY